MQLAISLGNGTHEDERTVLYRTKSLDGTKPDTNPKTNATTNPNSNTNPVQLFYAFSEHRPLIFSVAWQTHQQYTK